MVSIKVDSSHLIIGFSVFGVFLNNSLVTFFCLIEVLKSGLIDFAQSQISLNIVGLNFERMLEIFFSFFDFSLHGVDSGHFDQRWYMVLVFSQNSFELFTSIVDHPFSHFQGSKIIEGF